MAVAATFTATGQSDALRVDKGGFNMNLRGTFVATVQLERSFDGTNWDPLTALGGSISFTGPCSEVFEEPEGGVEYRLNCTSYTSGTVTYRLGQ